MTTPNTNEKAAAPSKSAEASAHTQHAIAIEQSRDTARSIHNQACELQREQNISYPAARHIMEEAPETARKLAQVTAQRDSLLSALKSVVSDLEWGTASRWKGEGSKSLRAAIAAVENSQQ